MGYVNEVRYFENCFFFYFLHTLMKVDSVTFDLKVVFTFIGTFGKSAYLKCVFSVTSEYVKEPLIRKYVIKPTACL